MTWEASSTALRINPTVKRSATSSTDPVHGVISLVSLLLIILAGFIGYEIMGWSAAIVFAVMMALLTTLIEAIIGGIRRLIRPLPPQ